jgi:hypothetical protein
MNVLRHHHLADDDEMVPTPHLLQNSQKQITVTGAGEQRAALITAGRDEVGVAGAVVAM